MSDMLSGPPPPPSMADGSGGMPSAPSMQMLAGRGASQPSPGQGQVGGAVVRMALEIDQALKLLAQAMPMLSPWVEKTVSELRQQIGQALNSGQVPTNPSPGDNARFPGGGSNL